MTGHNNLIILSHANIYHDILFSCFFLRLSKKSFVAFHMARDEGRPLATSSLTASRPKTARSLAKRSTCSESASSSSKKKPDLKGMLIDGLCFSMERIVIFPLRNVKCKDYVSRQVVETTHLRLICIWRIKSRSSSTRKKPRKSDY